jgi:5-formyltetrahydrofolate cyclo-ligase
MPASSSKAELRAAALARREALSPEQRRDAAQAIAAHGLPFEVAAGMVVSGYAPIRSEIDPTPLMLKLAAQGARLALPAVTARGQALTFRAWSASDRMVLGALGIPEPSPAAAELVPDVMLVPLIMTIPSRIYVNRSRWRASGLLLQRRKSRPFRRWRTTWRWIMC